MTEQEFFNLLSESESETLEFKSGNEDPERIGKYVSALANSAAMLGKNYSYMIWGVSDDKDIIGTNFYPKTKKVGGMPFITWLEKCLTPRINLSFEELSILEKHIVVLVVNMSVGQPVSFKDARYIRSGSSVVDIKKFPEKEREVWRSFDSVGFEMEYAKTGCTVHDIYDLIDINIFLKMLNYPIESTEDEIITHLLSEKVIVESGDKFNITNLGAFTFAKLLSKFNNKLEAHALRVIRYKGTNKYEATSEMQAKKGIAVGFNGLLAYIKQQLPVRETYASDGRRVIESDYPSLVIRELVANQIVHQDFSIDGSSPLIEIYDNRIEFTNPGAPINDVARLLDLPPISRNKKLANLFRKMNFIEERGSGIDKVIIELEFNHLPAPDIAVKKSTFSYTVVTLFERKKLSEMTDKEKSNALYYHSSLKYIENDFMTNKSVRNRFNLNDNQSSVASKAIKIASEKGLIKPYNKKAGPKFMEYIPFWAEEEKNS